MARAEFRNFQTEQWVELVQRYLRSLESYMCCVLEHEPIGPNVGDGFSVDFISMPSHEEGALTTRWKGILGGDLRHESLSVRVWLFAYVAGERVAPESKTFLQLRASEESDGSLKWSVVGWFAAEHGEFDYFDKWKADK